ncbi:unnamed protein product, partial [Iphiclides podalirius]
MTEHTILTMKLLLALLLAASASADNHCRGIYFNEKYYNVHIIKEGVNRIDSLTLNRNDDILYFTFDQIASPPNRQVAYMDMDTKETKIVEGIDNATSIAIDQKYNKIYVGSRSGLYKINERRQAELLPVRDDIRYVHFKDVLYFVNAKGETYIFEDGLGVALTELRDVKVDSLIVDNDNNVLFTRDKTLFRIKLGTRAVNIHEKVHVDVLSTDVYVKAHVCAPNGVFVYNKYKFVLDKVADMRDLRGLTFNKANEPVYAVKDLIIKLSENPIPCFGD